MLADFDRPMLRAICEMRDTINPDGWTQKMIREYLDVWG